jgi:Domain of unknown function (DUF4157)
MLSTATGMGCNGKVLSHEAVQRPRTRHADGADADRRAEAIARRVTATGPGRALVQEVARPSADGRLAPDARRALQSALGHDFGAMRVHHDALSQASAAAIGARALNVGPHVMMGSDPSLAEPASYAGTLVHEAVHVAQRGLAPPLRAPAIARPLVQPIGGLPAILRQGGSRPLDRKWFPPLKKFVQDNGLPAVVGLVNRLNLANTGPQRFHTATLGNDRHEWELTLRFVPGPRSETKTLPDKATAPAASTPGRPPGPGRAPGKTVTHRFDVTVQFDFSTWDPRDTNVPASVATDPRQKGLYLAASALYHELTHVVLLTDPFLQSQGAAAQGIATGGLSSAYGVVTQAAASGAFATVRTGLIAALTTAGQAASRDLNLGRSPADITSWATIWYDKFVQEKFAFAATAKQFATSPRDSSIALSYVLIAIETLIGDPALAPMLIRRLQADPRIDAVINQAAGAAVNVFARIDQLLTPVSPGPGAIRTPPLGIGGQPIRE